MGLLTDWGTNDEFEDLDAARKVAIARTTKVSTDRKWPAYYGDTVKTFIESAYAANDGWLSDDVDAFWRDVAAKMDALTSTWVTAKTPVPAGWEALARTFSAGEVATKTATAGKALGDVSTVVAGTVEGAVDDVVTAVNPLKSWMPWAALAAAFVVWKASR